MIYYQWYMIFFEPRPVLFKRDDLIALRTQKGVYDLVPGLTSWAQVTGRGELPISQKVDLDVKYLHHQSLWLDVKIIWMTFIKANQKRRGVSLTNFDPVYRRDEFEVIALN